MRDAGFSTMLGVWVTPLLFAFTLLSSAASASHPVVVTWDDLAPNGEAFEGVSAQDSSGIRTAPNGSAGGLDAFDPLAASHSEPSLTPGAWDVTSTLVDQAVMIDGYILPLDRRGDRVVEFLLVPWVGACIHTPSPPPNQIVRVVYPEGLAHAQEFSAWRVAGTLRYRPATHDLFLVDGRRDVPAVYALSSAEIVGAPDRIVAASTADLPFFMRLQVWVNTLFTERMSAIAEGGSSHALLIGVLLCFVYGAIHTLGPGHGKAIVVSYFVGTGGSLSRGVVMGLRIAVYHVLSAVAVVFLLDFAVRQATGAAPSDYRAIRLGSYAIVVMIGAVMLWQAVSATLRQRAKPDGHTHVHTNGGHAGCAACSVGATQQGSGWVAVAVGIVPCTGALIVMLFGLANDLIWPAVLMVVAISAGMALAMSAIGVSALLGRRWAERGILRDAVHRRRFANGARLTGSASVLTIGAVLFAVTLAQFPSDLSISSDTVLATGFGLVGK